LKKLTKWSARPWWHIRISHSTPFYWQSSQTYLYCVPKCWRVAYSGLVMA